MVIQNDKYQYQLTQFGKRLRQIRKQKKLTQLDLEIATGIYSSDVSRIENGQKNIEFITIIKFAEALQVDLIQLFVSHDLEIQNQPVGECMKNKSTIKQKQF